MNLTIVNDDVLEMVESFTVSLGNPNPNNSIQTEDRFAHSTSRISIDPATAVIHITDNDGGDCTYVNANYLGSHLLQKLQLVWRRQLSLSQRMWVL